MGDHQNEPARQINKERIMTKAMPPFLKVNKIFFIWLVLICLPLPAAEAVQAYTPQVVHYNFNQNVNDNVCGTVINSSESYHDGVGQRCYDSICSPWSPGPIELCAGQAKYTYYGTGCNDTIFQSCSSDLILKIDCPLGTHLKGWLNVGTYFTQVVVENNLQAQPNYFTLNGLPPFQIYNNESWYNWMWNGSTSWSLPLEISCGDTFTLTPSATTGQGTTILADMYFLADTNSCDINITSSPSEVWPMLPPKQRPSGYNAYTDTASTVMVSLKSPAPPEGCTIDLSVEPVDNSGGHSHTGNRPKGRLSQTSVSFSGGQTGAKNVTYTSSEVSGEEKVVAKVKGEKKGEAKVTVRVPGLVPLENSIAYNLTGSTSSHSSNHYGLPSTNAAVNHLTFDYAYETDTLLGINDMSLEKGGLFDYKATWAPPHNSHRKGTSVDIDSMAQSTETWGYVRVLRDWIERLCNSYQGHLVPEGTIHCEFYQ